MASIIHVESKKVQIERLLVEGKLTDEEIAERTGTTFAYEQKVKSLMRSRAKQARDGSHDVSAHIASQATADAKVNTRKEQRTQRDIASREEINERRKMLKNTYKAFSERKGPNPVVAKYGYDSDFVASEHAKFQKYNNCDIITVQHRFIERYRTAIVNAGSWAKHLLSKYERDGFLNNEDYLELTNLIYTKRYEDGRDEAVDLNTRLPEGWVKITCPFCKKPVDGVIVRKSKIDKPTAVLCSADFAHSICVSTRSA